MKILVKVFTILIIFTIGVFAHNQADSLVKIIYKSSFDESKLLPPKRNDSEIWWQKIENKRKKRKKNSKTKKEIGSFQIIVNNKRFYNYVSNKIEKTKGIDNIETKALHQVIKKKEHEWTQDPYLIETNDHEVKQLYISYSLKYPKNLSQLIGKDGWVVLSEYKTVSDYRLALYVYRDKSKKLYWYAHGDNVVVDDVPYIEYWERENRDIPVPVGEWMDVEIFWKRSHGHDGRVWLSINGRTVIDYHGKTKIKDPIRIIMLYTNYASRPIDQWIDNVEVWNGFPCGEGKSCHKNKNKIKQGKK